MAQVVVRAIYDLGLKKCISFDKSESKALIETGHDNNSTDEESGVGHDKPTQSHKTEEFVAVDLQSEADSA